MAPTDPDPGEGLDPLMPSEAARLEEILAGPLSDQQRTEIEALVMDVAQARCDIIDRLILALPTPIEVVFPMGGTRK